MNDYMRRYIKNAIWCPAYLSQYYKLLYGKTNIIGTFVVTLDVETASDFVHWMDQNYAVKKAEQNRKVIKKVIYHANSCNLPLTWFCTGHSLLEGCSNHLPRIYPWATTDNGFVNYYNRKDWFISDPHGSCKSHPEWYFGDIFKEVAHNPLFEIGSHSFGHIRADLATTDEFNNDMKDLHLIFSNQNIKLYSHAFPWNKCGHLDLLKPFGIRSLRVKQGRFPSGVREVEYNNGMAITYQSFEGRPASYWCLKLGIDLAANTGLTFVWLVHPEELTKEINLSIYSRVCDYVLSLRESKRIRVSKMCEV